MSLSDQHEKSFEKINMRNYQDIETDLDQVKSLTICLNSLHKLKHLEDHEIRNYILYIDEISSFCEFVNNDLLDGVMKQTICTLTRSLKLAKKVIVSDALINDATFELLKNRTNIIMLTDTVKKYEHVNAIHLKSESEFLTHLIDNCANDRPFLFGCDSCKIITQFYQQCKSLHQDKEDKFILITADTDYRVKDATVEFKNKFVFFSPKITFGVDFSVPDAQDMYIYMNGQSIQPSGVFQQSTRCRNIQNLYYFGNCTQDVSKYETLDQLKDDVRKCLLTSKTFATTCTYLDENDEFKIIENTFFNLFYYNEFVKDIYESNKLKHFELIVQENGFNMSSEGDKDKANIEIDLNELNDTLFENFLQSENPTDKNIQISCNMLRI